MHQILFEKDLRIWKLTVDEFSPALGDFMSTWSRAE